MRVPGVGRTIRSLWFDAESVSPEILVERRFWEIVILEEEILEYTRTRLTIYPLR